MRVTPDFLAQIDEWRRHQPDIPPRAESIRRLIEIGLRHAPLSDGMFLIDLYREVSEGTAKPSELLLALQYLADEEADRQRQVSRITHEPLHPNTVRHLVGRDERAHSHFVKPQSAADHAADLAATDPDGKPLLVEAKGWRKVEKP